jgi:gluconolactonase
LKDVSVVAEGLAFPEGPVVMPDGSVIVTEIAAGQITRVWEGGRKEVIATPGGGPNGAQIGADGALYVCNSGGIDYEVGLALQGPEHIGRIERVDLSTGKVERLFDHCDGVPLSAPNDLVVDATGGIWFTDWGKLSKTSKDRGGIYYCRADGSEIRKAFDGYDVASYNGIGLSPDGSVLYVADTPSARILAFDLASPGVMAPVLRVRGLPGRSIAHVPGDIELDSLAVTAGGKICVGTIWTGGVAVIDPRDGSQEHYPLDDPFVTNIAFGGPNLRTAYITLSSSGRLVRTQWPEAGLKLN